MITFVSCVLRDCFPIEDVPILKWSIQTWQRGPPGEKSSVVWEMLRARCLQPVSSIIGELLRQVIRLGWQRRRRLPVTRCLARRGRIRFVKLEDTCDTVTWRRGRGWRQSHGDARSAERGVSRPSMDEKRRTGAAMEDGGWRGIGVQRGGDDVLDGVVWGLLLQRDRSQLAPYW